jgi:hypothetical protein
VKVKGCDLCEAARMSRWYHEDGTCWVADCEACDVPIVVWNEHGAEPGAGEVDHMLSQLARVAAGRFGESGYSIDRVMRQIPDHFHAHARDRNRWRSHAWPPAPAPAPVPSRHPRPGAPNHWSRSGNR